MAFKNKFRVSMPMVLVFVLLASVLAYTFKEGFTEGGTAPSAAKAKKAAPPKTGI